MVINTSGEVIKGSLKTFLWNFQKDGSATVPKFIVKPSAGKVLRLKRIRGVFSTNNEDVSIVMEVWVMVGTTPTLVKQLFYYDWNDILSQMDEVKVVDSLRYFIKGYELTSDLEPFELKASQDPELRIYFTVSPKGTVEADGSYAVKNPPLAKKDINSAVEPVSSITIECVSYDE